MQRRRSGKNAALNAIPESALGRVRENARFWESERNNAQDEYDRWLRAMGGESDSDDDYQFGLKTRGETSRASGATKRLEQASSRSEQTLRLGAQSDTRVARPQTRNSSEDFSVSHAEQINRYRSEGETSASVSDRAAQNIEQGDEPADNEQFRTWDLSKYEREKGKITRDALDEIDNDPFRTWDLSRYENEQQDAVEDDIRRPGPFGRLGAQGGKSIIFPISRGRVKEDEEAQVTLDGISKGGTWLGQRLGQHSGQVGRLGPSGGGNKPVSFPIAKDGLKADEERQEVGRFAAHGANQPPITKEIADVEEETHILKAKEGQMFPQQGRQVPSPQQDRRQFLLQQQHLLQRRALESLPGAKLAQPKEEKPSLRLSQTLQETASGSEKQVSFSQPAQLLPEKSEKEAGGCDASDATSAGNEAPFRGTTSFHEEFDATETAVQDAAAMGVSVKCLRKNTATWFALRVSPCCARIGCGAGKSPEYVQSCVAEEFGNLQDLRHPNIAALTALYLERRSLFVVRPQIQGVQPLICAQWSGVDPTTFGAEVARQLLSALAHCHRRGLCHLHLGLEEGMSILPSPKNSVPPQVTVYDIGLRQPELWPRQGEKVEVFSRTRDRWLPGYVMERALKDGAIDDYPVSVGTVKVVYGNGIFKYITPDEIEGVLRRPPGDEQMATTATAHDDEIAGSSVELAYAWGSAHGPDLTTLRLLATAPEIIDGRESSSSADLWSIGFVVFVLVVGSLPFESNFDWQHASPGELLQAARVAARNLAARQLPKGIAGDAGGIASRDLVDFCQNLLCLSPERRPTAEKMSGHPWLSSNPWTNKSNSSRVDATAMKARSAALHHLTDVLELRRRAVALAAKHMLHGATLSQITPALVALDGGHRWRLPREDFEAVLRLHHVAPMVATSVAVAFTVVDARQRSSRTPEAEEVAYVEFVREVAACGQAQSEISSASVRPTSPRWQGGMGFPDASMLLPIAESSASDNRSRSPSPDDDSAADGGPPAAKREDNPTAVEMPISQLSLRAHAKARTRKDTAAPPLLPGSGQSNPARLPPRIKA